MNIDSSLEYSKVQDNEKETKNVFGDYQEEGIEMADPNLWLEQGGVEWNPINRQMNHQIENCDGSGDK